MTPPRQHSWIALWERMGAHGDLQAVFDTDPPQDIIDEMDDVDDVLAPSDTDYITSLRRRRGSRSVSEASGVWSRSRSHGVGEYRRRSTRESQAVDDEDHPDPTPEVV